MGYTMARKVTAGHQAMRASEHGSFDRQAFREREPWEVVALDVHGNELYRTESFETREEAQANCDTFDAGTESWTDNIPSHVAGFEPRKKE
jgi:hypothetical protein